METTLRTQPAVQGTNPWPWVLGALVGGLAAGWVDRGSGAVQGPLILFMGVAFLTAIPRRAPAWAIAIACAVGLPLAHLIGKTLGDQAGATWGMAVVLIPVAIAAYAGAGVGSLLTTASSLIDRRLLIASVILGCAIVGAGPVYATLVARGQPFAWWVTTIWQFVTLVAWAVISPVVLRTWQQMHDSEHGMTRSEFGTHATLVLGIAVAHGILLPVATRILFIPLGSASVRDAAAWAFVAYLPLDLLTYLAVCGAAYASDVDRRRQVTAQREAAVRGELAVAQLAGLRAQLRPHFLFNTLNTASVLAARGDADGTRRVLTGLGDLLRYALRGDDRPDDPSAGLVPLRDEFAFVEQYLSIERERFPERLRTSLDMAPDVRDAMIPALLIQPLVENAIAHGVGGRIGAGVVAVRARRVANGVQIAIEDDGPGVTATPNADPGIGLANTRARLAVLYGNAATLSLESRPQGGAVATVTLPLRFAL